jgi:hypothetical protein
MADWRAYFHAAWIRAFDASAQPWTLCVNLRTGHAGISALAPLRVRDSRLKRGITSTRAREQSIGVDFALTGRRVDTILIKLVQRIREEFQEAPGLRLTSNQAARFWGLDLQTCESVLTELLRAGFLLQGSDGRYQQC